MEKRKQAELNDQELEQIQGGARMAQAPGGKPGQGGTRAWYEGNLAGDVIDNPTGPTVDGVIPLDDPQHAVE